MNKLAKLKRHARQVKPWVEKVWAQLTNPACTLGVFRSSGSISAAARQWIKLNFTGHQPDTVTRRVTVKACSRLCVVDIYPCEYEYIQANQADTGYCLRHLLRGFKVTLGAFV